ncbi:MAG TPA: sporulation protein YqfC [Firmicutes bacterium]|nr:sporulation protein YqfC [Bacillota bacterium]
MRERVSTALELPEDLFTTMPRITILGNKRFSLENHRGIIQYDSDLLCVGFGAGQITLKGKGFNIVSIAPGVLVVEGTIRSIEFQG